MVRDGQVVEWNDYYAYGAVRDGATSSGDGRWKYLGKELDNETATQHLDAREYDPLVGIFNKPDRFAFKYPAYTPYGYSKQNPFLFSDPSGDTVLIKEGDPVPPFLDPVLFINPIDVYLSVNPLAVLRSGIKSLAGLVRRYLNEDKNGTEMSSEPTGLLNEGSQRSERWINAEQKLNDAAQGQAGTETRFVTNSNGEIVDLKPTIDRISSGGKHPHRNDGSVFQNRPLPGKSTPELPTQPLGYYNEYVVPTPGLSAAGKQRIVTGKGGEVYFTSDHYKTFTKIK